MRDLPVTAVVPVYNRRDSLKSTIESILAQRGSRVAQTIVADDASTDDSTEVARSLGCDVITLTENGGSAAARNAALERVETPWVAFLDSDDLWHEDLLEVLWPHTSRHVLVSGAALLSIDGQIQTVLGSDRLPGIRIASPADLLTTANPIVTSATIVRTDLIRDTGGFDTTIRYSEDLDLWLRVLESGEAWCDASPVLTYRRAKTSKSQQAQGVIEAARERIVRSYAAKPWWSRTACEQYLGANYWEGARTAVRGRAWASACAQLTHALRSPARVRGASASVARNLRRRRRATTEAGP